ncbi:MAG: hypothetical protein PHP69_04620 [Candidatus Omnitrophica bacterium]|nr:hypothetical protein [Candidatus Omnitrophota bacterium]MDD5081655.1 hypothetical protein [Candidatus Omnitrophota bacterium]
MRVYLIKKTQAMVEMAILVPLVIAAIGTVILYLCQLNGDQYQIMQAFRKALKKSHDENKAVSYGTWDDRRQADVNNPIVGQKVINSGSGAVMWAIPSVEDGDTEQGNVKEKTYIAINSAGGRFGPVIEYDLGEKASGGVETRYVTTTYENLDVKTEDGQTSSTRSAGSAEVMMYKVGDKHNFTQGRVYGEARSISGGE